MSIWANIWDDAATDRDEELEWEPVIDEDDEDEDDDIDLDLDLDEVTSLDEWLAEVA
jgi:hypothetical protein